MHTSDRFRNILREYWWIIVAILMYSPQIFFGYGVDDDTYLVLGAGEKTMKTGIYHPSRNPGYFIFETITWGLDRAGGSIATNTATMVMTIFALGAFRSMCRFFNMQHDGYLLAFFMIHPFVWANAAATQDYMWAVGLILLGFNFLLKGRNITGAFLLGLSVGLRLSSVFAVAGILLYVVLAGRTGWKHILSVIGLILIVSISAYVPSFANANWTLGFLTPHMGTDEIWTPLLRFGKCIYKSVSFWGLQAFLFIVIMIIVGYRGKRIFEDKLLRTLSIMAFIIVTAYELLFYRYPIEEGYLLPMLPFFILLFGTAVSLKKWQFVLLLGLLFTSNFIKIDLLKPNVPRHATSVEAGFWLGEGPLIHDLRVRYNLGDCRTIERWNEVMFGLEQKSAR